MSQPWLSPALTTQSKSFRLMRTNNETLARASESSLLIQESRALVLVEDDGHSAARQRRLFRPTRRLATTRR